MPACGGDVFEGPLPGLLSQPGGVVGGDRRRPDGVEVDGPKADGGCVHRGSARLGGEGWQTSVARLVLMIGAHASSPDRRRRSWADGVPTGRPRPAAGRTRAPPA